MTQLKCREFAVQFMSGCDIAFGFISGDSNGMVAAYLQRFMMLLQRMSLDSRKNYYKEGREEAMHNAGLD